MGEASQGEILAQLVGKCQHLGMCPTIANLKCLAENKAFSEELGVLGPCLKDVELLRSWVDGIPELELVSTSRDKDDAVEFILNGKRFSEQVNTSMLQEHEELLLTYLKEVWSRAPELRDCPGDLDLALQLWARISHENVILLEGMECFEPLGLLKVSDLHRLVQSLQKQGLLCLEGTGSRKMLALKGMQPSPETEEASWTSDAGDHSPGAYTGGYWMQCQGYWPENTYCGQQYWMVPCYMAPMPSTVKPDPGPLRPAASSTSAVSPARSFPLGDIVGNWFGCTHRGALHKITVVQSYSDSRATLVATLEFHQREPRRLIIYMKLGQVHCGDSILNSERSTVDDLYWDRVAKGETSHWRRTKPCDAELPGAPEQDPRPTTEQPAPEKKPIEKELEELLLRILQEEGPMTLQELRAVSKWQKEKGGRLITFLEERLSLFAINRDPCQDLTRVSLRAGSSAAEVENLTEKELVRDLKVVLRQRGGSVAVHSLGDAVQWKQRHKATNGKLLEFLAARREHFVVELVGEGQHRISLATRAAPRSPNTNHRPAAKPSTTVVELQAVRKAASFSFNNIIGEWFGCSLMGSLQKITVVQSQSRANLIATIEFQQGEPERQLLYMTKEGQVRCGHSVLNTERSTADDLYWDQVAKGGTSHWRRTKPSVAHAVERDPTQRPTRPVPLAEVVVVDQSGRPSFSTSMAAEAAADLSSGEGLPSSSCGLPMDQRVRPFSSTSRAAEAPADLGSPSSGCGLREPHHSAVQAVARLPQDAALVQPSKKGLNKMPKTH